MKMKVNQIKIAAILLVTTLTIVSCGGRSQKNQEETKKDMSDSTKYTCPMHPEVISDKPGTCPKCGMDLKKVKK
jgi:Cu(I)/Ag(I) efflux system membrane fusion protein